MALVVLLQEDEPSVFRNLKIFCETAPWPFIPWTIIKMDTNCLRTWHAGIREVVWQFKSTV